VGNYFVTHDDVQIPKSKWGILVTYDGIILTLIFGNYIQSSIYKFWYFILIQSWGLISLEKGSQSPSAGQLFVKDS
jgi:hypothetical protein